MKAFTIHRRRAGRDPVDDIRLLPDAFSWGAFLVGPFWFVNQGAVISCLLDAAAMLLILHANRWLDWSRPEIAVVLLLVRIAIGAEARNVLRFGMKFRGWHFEGALNAETIEMAEIRYFAASPEAATAISPRMAPFDLGALAGRLQRKAS